MRTGRAKIANDKVMSAALKDNWRDYRKNGVNSKNAVRFFFFTKFESSCQLCRSVVPIGVKAMIRPATKALPKLFCCYECSAPWREGESDSPLRAIRVNYELENLVDVENQEILDTSGDRDEIYKTIDEIYNQD